MFSSDPNHTLQLPKCLKFHLRYWETNPFNDEPYQVLIYEHHAQGDEYYAAVLPAAATPDIHDAPAVFGQALAWDRDTRTDTLIWKLVDWFAEVQS